MWIDGSLYNAAPGSFCSIVTSRRSSHTNDRDLHGHRSLKQLSPERIWHVRLVLARINCLSNSHHGLGSLRFFVNVLERHGSDAQISLWQGLYDRNPNPIHMSRCASALKSSSQSFLYTSSLWSLYLESALYQNLACALLSPCFILFKYRVFLFAKLLNYNSNPKQVVFSLFFLLEPRL